MPLHPVASSSSSLGNVISAPTSSGSSGEFHAFSFVGSSMPAGGGGQKQLFLFDIKGSVSPCLGSVSGLKFCIKDCIDGKTCGVPTHATRKAKVETFRFYVKENEAKAFLFLDPSIDSRYFTDEQVAILLSQVHSRFTQKNSG